MDQGRRALTDGEHLYRFLGSIASRAGELIGIENCRSLEIMLVAVEELRTGRLRAVAMSGFE